MEPYQVVALCLGAGIGAVLPPLDRWPSLVAGEGVHLERRQTERQSKPHPRPMGARVGGEPKEPFHPGAGRGRIAQEGHRRGTEVSGGGRLSEAAHTMGNCEGPRNAERARHGWRELGCFRVSAYCSCTAVCCPGFGTHFADGTPVPNLRRDSDGLNRGEAMLGTPRILAAPRSIPFGTRLYLDGVGWCVVRDRGGAITEGRLDLYHESHEAALRWGVQEKKVWVLLH